MLFLASLLAFYLAWNLGANDVANSMGTSVGSKALTLRQALWVAGCLEFLGAVVFGQGVSSQLATGILNLDLFTQSPDRFLLGMMAVLISCCLWLNVATIKGWPVSSSHAVVGAIAGFGAVSSGFSSIHWQALGSISLTWVLTPIVTGLLAAIFYQFIQRTILLQPHAHQHFQEWLPWLSVAILGVFGTIVFGAIEPTLQVGLDGLGWSIPVRDVGLGLGAIAVISLTASGLQRLSKKEPDSLEPASLEPEWARLQVLSASFVAFAHGSNDVGNAIAPLAMIFYIATHHQMPLTQFSVSLWLLVLGGCGIVCGLAMLGKNVIHTIGEDLTPLQPSSGFIAEFVTAVTVLMASRWGFPVSTSHAIVGSVVGIGLTRDRQALQMEPLQKIMGAWLITIPLCGTLSAGLFWLLEHLMAWVNRLG